MKTITDSLTLNVFKLLLSTAEPVRRILIHHYYHDKIRKQTSHSRHSHSHFDVFFFLSRSLGDQLAVVLVARPREDAKHLRAEAQDLQGADRFADQKGWHADHHDVLDVSWSQPRYPATQHWKNGLLPTIERANSGRWMLVISGWTIYGIYGFVFCVKTHVSWRKGGLTNGKHHLLASLGMFLMFRR